MKSSLESQLYVGGQQCTNHLVNLKTKYVRCVTQQYYSVFSFNDTPLIEILSPLPNRTMLFIDNLTLLSNRYYREIELSKGESQNEGVGKFHSKGISHEIKIR